MESGIGEILGQSVPGAPVHVALMKQQDSNASGIELAPQVVDLILQGSGCLWSAKGCDLQVRPPRRRNRSQLEEIRQIVSISCIAQKRSNTEDLLHRS